MAPSNVLQLNKYKKGPVNILFDTNTLHNTSNVLVYKIGPFYYSFIRVKNNRMYRVIGLDLIEILVTNIPSNWECVGVFKHLTDSNLKFLISTFMSKNK